MKIAAIIRELCEKRRMYSTFWFTHYYGFSAIMILHVRVIQLAAQKGSPEEVSRYLQKGEQAQRDLTTYGSRSSLVQRYVVVLEELLQEAPAAASQNNNHQVPNTTRDNTFSYGHDIPEMGLSTCNARVQADELESVNGTLQTNKVVVENRNVEEPGGLQSAKLMIAPSMQSNPPQWPEGGVENSLTVTGFTEFQDWGQLDSLAVAGMGGLDVLFSQGRELNDSRETSGDR